MVTIFLVVPGPQFKKEISSLRVEAAIAKKTKKTKKTKKPVSAEF